MSLIYTLYLLAPPVEGNFVFSNMTWYSRTKMMPGRNAGKILCFVWGVARHICVYIYMYIYRMPCIYPTGTHYRYMFGSWCCIYLFLQVLRQCMHQHDKHKRIVWVKVGTFSSIHRHDQWYLCSTRYRYISYQDLKRHGLSCWWDRSMRHGEARKQVWSTLPSNNGRGRC
jgi:hypothetical protein